MSLSGGRHGGSVFALAASGGLRFVFAGVIFFYGALFISPLMIFFPGLPPVSYIFGSCFPHPHPGLHASQLACSFLCGLMAGSAL